MKMVKIYTLEWIEKEAHLINDYWNGKDDKFVDGDGEQRTYDEAEVARALLEELESIREKITYLNI